MGDCGCGRGQGLGRPRAAESAGAGGGEAEKKREGGGGGVEMWEMILGRRILIQRPKIQCAAYATKCMQRTIAFGYIYIYISRTPGRVF